MVWKIVKFVIEEFGGDFDCVYLIGLSCGGYGIWGFVLKFFNLFVVIVFIVGNISGVDSFDMLICFVVWIVYNKGDGLFENMFEVIEVFEERIDEKFL